MDEYLQFAKDLAYKAGDIMLAHFKAGVATATKADNTPVTVADTAINSLVINTVKIVFPEHGILGEEQSDFVQGTQFVWVCDPIDGTSAYAMGVPTNMFSLALVENGSPIIAVLYDPYLDRMYHTVKGGSAYMDTAGDNTQVLHVSSQADLQDCKITLPAWKIKNHDVSKILHMLIEENVHCFATQSTTYEAALVTSGQITAAIYLGTAPWDIAAAALLVKNAGGSITSLDGTSIDRYDTAIPNGAIISNGLIQPALLELIKKDVSL